MACYHPVAAYQEKAGDPVKFGIPGQLGNLALPCGKCIGCRTDRATMWANRCTHEASLWNSNQFLTLTYDDEHLPEENHLRPRDLQLFIKRVRKYAQGNATTLTRDTRRSLRYFACGEYGEANSRPHYHALIFNGAFTDLTRIKKDLYSSETLARLWPYGNHSIGAVTPRSAAYIAQYNLKKQGRGDFDADGVERQAPFLRMSRRPAIGHDWLTQYATDLQNGYLVENARKHPIPRYYRDKIKERLPALKELIDLKIQQSRMNNIGDKKDKARLQAQETTHTQRKQQSTQRTI